MAAAISSERVISIHSNRSEGRSLYGDKEVSEATLEKLANFILDNNYEQNYDTRMLRNLTITPLSVDEVRFGISLIHEHPLVTVVENELNESESGGTLVTMERTISVRDMHQFGITSNSGIALGSLESSGSIKIITVSKQAFDTLDRYIFSLTLCGKAVKFVKGFTPCICCLTFIGFGLRQALSDISKESLKDD